MSITAVELRTIGNERTGRAESQSDIDKFVKSWVADLTSRGITLEAEETVNFVDEQPNYIESAFTNNFKKIDAITVMHTDNTESPPLREISWQRYKERVSQDTAPGKPKEYARFNETIYVWPNVDADTYDEMKISGTIYHADSTIISYADRFRECGIQYIIFKIYEKYGLIKSKGVVHTALYKSEFDKLFSDQNTKENHTVRYNDI